MAMQRTSCTTSAAQVTPSIPRVAAKWLITGYNAKIGINDAIPAENTRFGPQRDTILSNAVTWNSRSPRPTSRGCTQSPLVRGPVPRTRRGCSRRGGEDGEHHDVHEGEEVVVQDGDEDGSGEQFAECGWFVGGFVGIAPFWVIHGYHGGSRLSPEARLGMLDGL